MNINIQHVAKLARLKIEDEQIEKFEKEMNDIVGMIENLPDLSDKAIGVDPSHPMRMREDTVKPSYKREEILKNAPKTQAGCIVVPKTVE